MSEQQFDQEREDEVFQYLDDLRASGVTNMFGATPYIEAQFRVDRREARRLLSKWMTTFNERHSGLVGGEG